VSPGRARTSTGVTSRVNEGGPDTVRVVATAVVGTPAGDPDVGLEPSEDPDAGRVVGVTEGEALVGATPPELVEDPDVGGTAATVVVGTFDGETSFGVSGPVLSAGEDFRYDSDRSTAPATTNATAKRATPARISLCIGEG
jgi:hypothetical protein